MQLGEMIVAGAVLAVCLAMLVRLSLGSARRARLDRAVLNAWHRGPMRGWQVWKRHRARRRQDRLDAERRETAARLQTEAEAEARDVIARARDRAQGRVPPSGSTPPPSDREGNVIRPHAFRKPEPGATHPGNDTRH